MLSRARFLSSALTTYQGERFVSVKWNISSLAREYSTHLSQLSRSISEIFQRLVGSSMRALKRFSCSSSLTLNQYFTRMMPLRMSMSSNGGQERKNSVTSSSEQELMTRSEPAPVYQDGAKMPHSPAAGRCAT